MVSARDAGTLEALRAEPYASIQPASSNYTPRYLAPSGAAWIQIHTNPGDSPRPSSTDEATFGRVFGRTDWAVMCILARGGQTEASVDLAQFAGLTPAAMICEVMNDDGAMARLPDLEIFAEKHGLKIISVMALQEYARSLLQRPAALRAAG